MTNRTPHRPFAFALGLGLAFIAALAVGGCSSAEDKRAEAKSGVVTTVAGTPSTTGGSGTTSPPSSTVPTTASTAPGRPATVRDWDGTRFDIGALDRIDRTEDGKTLVLFDRMQLDEGKGPTSGKDLTTEPVIYGNTDTPLVNDASKLRTYVAKPDMEVLRLANARETCDPEPPKPPRWEPVSVDQVVDQSLWNDYRQVSLTFSSDGYVSLLRLSTGC